MLDKFKDTSIRISLGRPVLAVPFKKPDPLIRVPVRPVVITPRPIPERLLRGDIRIRGMQLNRGVFTNPEPDLRIDRLPPEHRSSFGVDTLHSRKGSSVAVPAQEIRPHAAANRRRRELRQPDPGSRPIQPGAAPDRLVNACKPTAVPGAIPSRPIRRELRPLRLVTELKVRGAPLDEVPRDRRSVGSLLLQGDQAREALVVLQERLDPLLRELSGFPISAYPPDPDRLQAMDGQELAMGVDPGTRERHRLRGWGRVCRRPECHEQEE